MYQLKDICFYTIVTLREVHINTFIDSFRKFYPHVPLFVLDNCGSHIDIARRVKNKHNVEVIKSPDIYQLTKNQNILSQRLFAKYKVLGFSGDDVKFKAGGFLEKSLEILNGGKQIVSLCLNTDPMAYLYTENFWKDSGGFNENLFGKDYTDRQLIYDARRLYKDFPHIGGKWHKVGEGWESNYLIHYHGVHNVTKHLKDLGLECGHPKLSSRSNEKFLNKRTGKEKEYFTMKNNDLVNIVKSFTFEKIKQEFKDFRGQLEGDSAKMTGAGILHLLSECVANISQGCYLEVGSWKGASLCSTGLKNPQVKCYGIDNFSEFNTNTEEFLKKHIEKFKLTNTKYFKCSYQDFLNSHDDVDGQKVSVFFYDGSHGPRHHAEAMKKCKKLLNDHALVFVDDVGIRGHKPVLQEVLDYAKSDPQYSFVKDFTKESEGGPEGFHCGLACFEFNR